MFKNTKIGSLIVIDNVPKTNKTLSGREVGTVIYTSELLLTVQGAISGPEKYYKKDGSAFRRGVPFSLTSLSPAQTDKDNVTLYQKQKRKWRSSMRRLLILKNTKRNPVGLSDEQQEKSNGVDKPSTDKKDKGEKK